MRSLRNPILGLLTLPFALWAAHVGAQERGGGESWQRQAARYGWWLDYKEARMEARRTGKPLMVVFRCVP